MVHRQPGPAIGQPAVQPVRRPDVGVFRLPQLRGLRRSPGNVVRFYADGQGQEHGFLLQAGAYTSIDFPGAVATEANGTNKHGDIVGDYTDSAGLIHGFALMDGRFQDVDAPFATGELSVRVTNDSRIVVGMYMVRVSLPSADRLEFATFQLSSGLAARSRRFPRPLRVPNAQEIVGDVNLIGAAYVAKAGLFELVARGLTAFDGVQSAQLNGVNDAGAIAGTFTDRTGTFGILLVPGSILGHSAHDDRDALIPLRLRALRGSGGVSPANVRSRSTADRQGLRSRTSARRYATARPAAADGKSPTTRLSGGESCFTHPEIAFVFKARICAVLHCKLLKS